MRNKMTDYPERNETTTNTSVFWVDDVIIHTTMNEENGRERMYIEINPNSIGSGDITLTLYSREGSFNFEFEKKVRK